MAGNFWTGEKPVVRHAVDHDSYCYAEGRQLDVVGHGNFVVVPRANEDGTSPAFSADDPGTIHVDPDAPDGGAIVNLSTLQERDVMLAITTSQYPHQAFYKLGESSPGIATVQTSWGQQVTPPRANSRSPNGYVVPASGPDGAQLPQMEAQAMERLPRRHRPSALHEVATPQLEQMPPQLYATPQPAPQQYQQPAYQPPPTYQPVYQPMQPDPQMAAAIHGLTQMVQGLSQRMDTMSQPVAVPSRAPGMQIAGASTWAEPPPAEPAPIPRVTRRRHIEQQAEAPPQTLDDYHEIVQNNDNGKTVIAGFETLKVPFLNGPSASKARAQAFFALANGAKMSAMFHGIVEAKNCVALIYDTRYEDGIQFMPPEAIDGPITLTVVASKKEYSVLSVGMTFRFGVLDFIILPINHGAEAEPE